MGELTALVIFVLALALVGALVWNRVVAKERDQYRSLYTRLNQSTDWRRLCREYQLERYEHTIKVTDSELRQADYPEHLLQVRTEDALRGLVKKMTDQGGIFIQRENLPSQPLQKITAFAYVSKGRRSAHDEAEPIHNAMDRIEEGAIAR